MSGRGVITSLTWVLANRTTAVIKRSSLVSCTGAGGTSGTGVGISSSAAVPLAARAAAQRAHQRIHELHVGVEAGKQQEERPSGFRRTRL